MYDVRKYSESGVGEMGLSAPVIRCVVDEKDVVQLGCESKIPESTVLRELFLDDASENGLVGEGRGDKHRDVESSRGGD